MKRLILPAIILFPCLTLVLWCYYGAKQPRLPVGQYVGTNAPALTNLNAGQGTN